MKQILQSSNAPKPIGPYSQAVKINDIIFTSGQIPIDKEGNVIEGDIKLQTRVVLNNLKNLLDDIGSSLGNVIKICVYLTNINEFSAMNEVYREYMDTSLPARSIAEVSRLPKNVKIEIDAVAYYEH